MVRALLFTLLMSLAGVSRSAIDLPVEARESYLKFRNGGELIVKSDGENIVSLKLSYGGVTRSLSGMVLQGIGQPDLTTVRLKLVAGGCKSGTGQCFNYSLPLVELSVGQIPEDSECPNDCLVHFLFENGAVIRRTFSGRGGAMAYHPPETFPIASD